MNTIDAVAPATMVKQHWKLSRDVTWQQPEPAKSIPSPEIEYVSVGDQAWYWHPEWLRGEAQASHDIATGDVAYHADLDSLLEVILPAD